MPLSTEIDRRRLYTERRWQALELLASDQFGSLEVASRTCIYVTGSMARGEATEGSDLDLFVVDALNEGDRRLNHVETAHLVAHLDNVREDAGFRPFSRGGEFVRTLSMQDLITLIGDPQDDALNTFTARMLLLINSRPLTNYDAYARSRELVLDKYWIPQAPRADFRPIMLLNDLRRWWGVLCLNFERFNPYYVVDAYSAQPTTERRVSNLKLRFARLMAAYTPILGLIYASTDDGIIDRATCDEILLLSPVERLLTIQEGSGSDSRVGELVREVIDAYNMYLIFMNRAKEELFRSVSQPDTWRIQKDLAYDFHKKFFSLFVAVGQGKNLFEYSIL